MTTRFTRTEIATLLSLVAPYALTLFLLRYTTAFSFIGLLLSSAVFIFGCLVVLLQTKETKYKKGYYFLGALASVLLFLGTYDQLVRTADSIFFSLNKARMTGIVKDIQKAKQEKKPIEIPQLNFALVETLEDGTVTFTLDGMLDNCVGIAYSADNKNPGYTNCGRIVEWRKLDDHWYFWYTT